MSNKTKIKIKPGARINITITRPSRDRRDEQGETGEREAPRGILPITRSQSRRIKRSKAGVEFFDLGRALAFSALLEYSSELDDLYLPASERARFTSAMIAADFDDRLAYVGSSLLYLDVTRYSGDDHKKRYMIGDTARTFLRDGNPEQTTETVTSPEWKAPGVFNPSDSFAHLRLDTYFYFEPFDTGDEVNYKVTSAPDFASEPVAFNGSAGKFSVGLVPRLYAERPLLKYAGDYLEKMIAGSPPFLDTLLFFIVETVPGARAITLPTSPSPLIGSTALDYTDDADSRNVRATATAAINSTVRARILAECAGRAFVFPQTVGSVNGYNYTTATVFAAAGFPSPLSLLAELFPGWLPRSTGSPLGYFQHYTDASTPPYEWSYAQGVELDPANAAETVAAAAGALVSIIKRGTQFFYVWRKTPARAFDPDETGSLINYRDSAITGGKWTL